MSEIDVLAALAETAAIENWCCPTIVVPDPVPNTVPDTVPGATLGGGSAAVIDIQCLRHPVVEAAIASGIGVGHGMGQGAR